MDLVLEVAAYAALGIGIALLTYRYLAPALPRAMRILRFRRGLKGFDQVFATWAAVHRADIVDSEELYRRRQSIDRSARRQDPGAPGAPAA